jgi:hypothetical protein
MGKTTLTRRLLWLLVQLAAAVTVNTVEEIKHWSEYGETRLREALTHKVEQLKLSNSSFIY